jgi:hypothetical protein
VDTPTEGALRPYVTGVRGDDMTLAADRGHFGVGPLRTTSTNRDCFGPAPTMPVTALTMPESGNQQERARPDEYGLDGKRGTQP